eukprot:1864264-Pyramimonas_sp.AAC.1
MTVTMCISVDRNLRTVAWILRGVGAMFALLLDWESVEKGRPSESRIRRGAAQPRGAGGRGQRCHGRLPVIQIFFQAKARNLLMSSEARNKSLKRLHAREKDCRLHSPMLSDSAKARGSGGE